MVLAILLTALIGRAWRVTDAGGQAEFRQILLENRSLSRLAASAPAALAGEALADRYATLRLAKLGLLDRLSTVSTEDDLAATRTAAKAALEADLELLQHLEERTRLEVAIAEMKEAYLSAVSRARGMPTRVEPRDSTRYLGQEEVRTALAQRHDLERQFEDITASIPALRKAGSLPRRSGIRLGKPLATSSTSHSI